jgi:hypothetical protein
VLAAVCACSQSLVYDLYLSDHCKEVHAEFETAGRADPSAADVEAEASKRAASKPFFFSLWAEHYPYLKVSGVSQWPVLLFCSTGACGTRCQPGCHSAHSDVCLHAHAKAVGKYSLYNW